MNWRTAKQRKQLWLAVSIILIFFIVRPLLWPGGFGFGESSSISSTLERNPQGVITKHTEVTTNNPGKTFWDWLSLLGVPVSLLLLGVYLQEVQQEKAKEQQEQDKYNAKDLQRQQALKDYFSEITTLLLDLDWNSNSSKAYKIKTLIRAKTLTVLGELDGVRKGSLVRFLVESKLIEKYPSLLRGADLSDAKLFGINITGADLSETNLHNAELFAAILKQVNFTGANLTLADLRGALLFQSVFDGAILLGTKLEDANVSSDAQFEASSHATKDPYLCSTHLPESFFNEEGIRKAIKFDRMRDCDKIPGILVARGYYKNINEAQDFIEALKNKVESKS